MGRGLGFDGRNLAIQETLVSHNKDDSEREALTNINLTSSWEWSKQETQKQKTGTLLGGMGKGAVQIALLTFCESDEIG